MSACILRRARRLGQHVGPAAQHAQLHLAVSLQFLLRGHRLKYLQPVRPIQAIAAVGAIQYQLEELGPDRRRRSGQYAPRVQLLYEGREGVERARADQAPIHAPDGGAVLAGQLQLVVGPDAAQRSAWEAGGVPRPRRYGSVLAP